MSTGREESKFKEGDVVVLNSGGPDMTVDQSTGTTCTCHWFLQEVLSKGTFRQESLTMSSNYKAVVRGIAIGVLMEGKVSGDLNTSDDGFLNAI